MRFTPKTDEELAVMNLIPAGKYPFEVVEAKDAVSKNGNEMIELKLKVWDDKGKERILFDRILEAWPIKLKHFCKNSGLLHKYDSGSVVADDCVGKSGHIELIIAKQADKYGAIVDRNHVKDYLASEKKQVEEKKENDFIDDEIPF